MNRNPFLAVILALSWMLVVEGGHAQAQEVFVGKFNSTKEIYLITESISGSSKDNFKCAVRVVDRVSKLIWKYEFFKVSGEVKYTLTMNTGYRHTSSVFDGQPYSQPAVNIYRYIQANY